MPNEHDAVNHPAHYTSHPSGIECIEITEHMGFNLGNALKYIWRADLKGDVLEDLRKAAWYVQREIDKREQARDTAAPEHTEVTDNLGNVIHQHWYPADPVALAAEVARRLGRQST
jgi:hypothetical protein